MARAARNKSIISVPRPGPSSTSWKREGEPIAPEQAAVEQRFEHRQHVGRVAGAVAREIVYEIGAAGVHELPEDAFVFAYSANKARGTIGEVHDQREAMVEEHVLDGLEVCIGDAMEDER